MLWLIYLNSEFEVVAESIQLYYLICLAVAIKYILKSTVTSYWLYMEIAMEYSLK